MPARKACCGPTVFAVLLLAAVSSAAVAAGDEPPLAPDSSARDLAVIRGRILTPLLEPGDVASVRRLIDAIRPDGTWPEVDYEGRSRSAWAACNHLSHLGTLARAYKSPKSKLRGDARLKKAVFAALDHWLEHDYQNPNWWWNQIGVPRTLAPTLLLLDGELSDAQRAKGLAILGRAKIGMTGQNLVWVTEITAKRGLLENDPDLVAQAYRRIADEIRVTTAEGIQPDFSFHQHGPVLYSHGYGAAFVLDCSRIATQVAGTGLAFPPEKIDILTRLILDGHQWFARGSACDYGASGRQIARKGQTARYLSGAARAMLELPTERDDEFRALAERSLDRPAPPLVGNRHFWRSDTMAHHREAYYTSARMYSTRTANTDMPCNSEGLTSHHVADGCNLIFRTGGEYRDLFPVWDWQKVPGTTVVQTGRLEGALRRQGVRDFVGGVSDGTYGLAAFDFARDGLVARKAWFFFDRQFVCLGTGIACEADHPVATTVNQCFLRGEVTVSSRQKTSTPSPGDHAIDAPAWMHHDSIAYVFPEPAAIHLHSGAQTGNWQMLNQRYSDEAITHDVFTLWIDHGKRPQGATYAYLVAPGMALADVADYAAEPGVSIVVNDRQIQAVRHEERNLTGVAFYAAGTLAAPNDLSLAVDAPCLLLVRELPDRLRVAAANPRNEALTLHVAVNRPLEGEGVEAGADEGASRITLELPGGMDAGRSVTGEFGKRGSPSTAGGVRGLVAAQSAGYH